MEEKDPRQLFCPMSRKTALVPLLLSETAGKRPMEVSDPCAPAGGRTYPNRLMGVFQVNPRQTHRLQSLVIATDARQFPKKLDSNQSIAYDTGTTASAHLKDNNRATQARLICPFTSRDADEGSFSTKLSASGHLTSEWKAERQKPASRKGHSPVYP